MLSLYLLMTFPCLRQVSSTLYNALINAELKIVERYPHSMAVSYVPLAADAALAGDYKDLVFENNHYRKNFLPDILHCHSAFVFHSLYLNFYLPLLLRNKSYKFPSVNAAVSLKINKDTVNTTLKDLGYSWKNKSVVSEAMRAGKQGNYTFKV